MSSHRDTSLRIPIISPCRLPTVLSPSPGSSSGKHISGSSHRLQAVRTNNTKTAVGKIQDGLNTSSQISGQRVNHASYQPLKRTHSNISWDILKNRDLPSPPPSFTKGQPRITHPPHRHRIKETKSRCSFIHPSGITFLSPRRRERTHTSSSSSDTSSLHSSHAGSTEYPERDPVDVFRAVPIPKALQKQEPRYRGHLDNGLTIGCSVSSTRAYSMESAPRSPSAFTIAKQAPNHHRAGESVGADCIHEAIKKMGTDDFAADAMYMTPKAIRHYKPSEESTYHQRNPNLTTPQRPIRRRAIHHSSPIKHICLQPSYLSPSGIGAKEEASGAGFCLFTEPLSYRARDVLKPVLSLSRRDQGIIAYKAGRVDRSSTAVAVGTATNSHNETSAKNGSVFSASRTHAHITNQARGLVPPVSLICNDVNAAVNG